MAASETLGRTAGAGVRCDAGARRARWVSRATGLRQKCHWDPVERTGQPRLRRARSPAARALSVRLAGQLRLLGVSTGAEVANARPSAGWGFCRGCAGNRGPPRSSAALNSGRRRAYARSRARRLVGGLVPAGHACLAPTAGRWAAPESAPPRPRPTPTTRREQETTISCSRLCSSSRSASTVRWNPSASRSCCDASRC
jgi:hypothetical protein